VPQAEKRSGKLTGWWYGDVDNRHKGGVRFRRRGEEPPGLAEGDITGCTFASVAQACEAGGPKGAFAPRAARGGPRFPSASQRARWS
jgi:hypothetical protein